MKVKQIRILSMIIILTGLVACEPPVTFTKPQPVSTDNLSEFPRRLKGVYLSLSDSSTLSINDNLIQRTYDFDYKVNPNQLDSTARLSGDTLINLETKEKILIKRDGDSLIIHFHDIDTLFLMDYDNVVRKFKGNYFLNTRYNKTSWSVEKMNLSKGQLIISSISTKDDIEKLKEITETAQDTVLNSNFTATKKEFNKFVKNDGFSDSEAFVRIKK
jgi:Holliday junction resolvase